MLDKNLIKLRFQKNLGTYDNSAIVQKKMAAVLVGKIVEFCGDEFGRIFEFGAGTGFLTKDILAKIKFNEYCANDITEDSENYVKHIISGAKFLSGDIEKIDICQMGEKFDLIASNAVMQWVIDTDEILLKMKNSLLKNGFAAFTTFGFNNYREIKEATGLSLNYLKTEALIEKCEKYFDIINFEENITVLYFNTPVDVLKHIKHSGTNALKSQNRTLSGLKNFEKFYKENFSKNNQVSLTYNPVFVILKPKT